jgi:hypothetical protein
MKKADANNRLELAAPETAVTPAAAERGVARPSAAERRRRPRTSFADDLLHIIFSQWRIIAAVAVATTLLAWLLAALQPNRYLATSVAAVTPLTDVMPANDRIRAIEALDQRTLIATIAALASTPLTKAGAFGGPHAGHGYEITAVPMPNTNLFRVNVEGADAARAAAVANRVPELLAAQSRSIFRYYGVTVVSPATTGALVFPRIGRAIAAGLVLGLIFGFAIAWAVTRLRPATLAA